MLYLIVFSPRRGSKTVETGSRPQTLVGAGYGPQTLVGAWYRPQTLVGAGYRAELLRFEGFCPNGGFTLSFPFRFSYLFGVGFIRCGFAWLGAFFSIIFWLGLGCFFYHFGLIRGVLFYHFLLNLGGLRGPTHYIWKELPSRHIG